ncbi:hypothetical protein J1N35_034390 [Gossypium stocksii]|uniref:Uncharacterized protein n=1 Tax=Gossypium stocksii TaxID=47602 RepID=A0A9D3URY4_9ROSI|nr:hypothetical protein J1N35_034390 [Gossypium stocksii]
MKIVNKKVIIHLSKCTTIRPTTTRDCNRPVDNLKNIKMTILPFQGKNDPDAYLEWEKKIELVFERHNYSEGKKRGDDATLAREVITKSIEMPQGPMTQSRAKKFQDALTNYVDRAWGEQIVESNSRAWTSQIGVTCNLLQVEFDF